VSDESGGETEIRKRAAWLLAMLAVVAILFALLMITVLGSNTGRAPRTALGNDPIRSLSAGPSSGSSQHPHKHKHTRKHPKPHQSAEHGSPAGSVGGSTTPTTGVSSTATGPAPHSCPSTTPCVLDGDIGNAITAVNAYRTEHGQAAVPGIVSPAAQQCAVSNGGDCSGEWAETWVTTADGQGAVTKVVSYAHSIATMKSFEIGWAYDPAGQQYFFAIVQNS
jgi:hypothetical protein